MTIATGEKMYAADILNLTFFPKGTILTFSSTAWSATSAEFKTIWKVCDGTGGTPDLQGRFLRGGTSTDDATTGGGTVELSEANLPAHEHSITGSTTSGGGKHYHRSGNNVSYNNEPDGNYPMTVARAWGGNAYHEICNDGAHVHSISGTAAVHLKHKAEAFDVIPAFYTVIYIIKVA
jgi:hypothetical protein